MSRQPAKFWVKKGKVLAGGREKLYMGDYWLFVKEEPRHWGRRIQVGVSPCTQPSCLCSPDPSKSLLFFFFKWSKMRDEVLLGQK